jgi:4-amino-4-deoxy-L-arabinose transferase-like glycosyltransferase
MTLPTRATIARFNASPPRVRDGVLAALVGFALRLLAVVWGAPRFPPAADGQYYQILASRVARGLGYTWQWPDGAVTYAAHYPIGYPALLGGLYAVVGTHVGAAMALGAVLGSLAVLAVHRVASREASRGGSLLAALLLALHPGLVFYTPAIMTEGVTASILALAAWLVVRARDAEGRRWRSVLALGALLGAATLVRPQSLLAAPLYGALCAGPGLVRTRLRLAGVVTVIVIAVCAPWTLRNCSRMNSCVVVSANAGWNLFIGAAAGATGTWVPLERLGVPSACRTVWGEAEKDACFERAGLQAIRARPRRWLGLVPAKLAATFDYAGAAGWYLHSSNPDAFGERAKLALGTAETIWQRLIVLLGLGALALGAGPLRSGRRGLALLAAGFLFVRAAWVAHIGLLAGAALLGRRLAGRPVAGLAVATLLSTAIAHGVFFGAGRYSLVCFPALAALAGTVLTAANSPVDTGPSKES